MPAPGREPNIERGRDVNAIVLVRAFEQQHAPWITAHLADHLGGEVIPHVPEAFAAIKAMVEGTSLLPIINQGLVDSREHLMAAHALTYFHQRGHRLYEPQLTTEALCDGWTRRAPLELARLAKEIEAGNRLRFRKRLVPEALAVWAHAS